MEALKKIMLIIYIVIAIALIIITTFQVKDNTESLEDTYENPRANNYYEKNKSRTKLGKVQKNTIILGVVFIILTIITTVLYSF